MRQAVFGYVWIAKKIGNQTVFLQTFTQRLRDCTYQSLCDDTENYSMPFT